ncbi:hypothetical protein SLEP1_g30952 [Rubroshorea leprosula]|uniref:Uncharacterized protein n=1 Tax=Rubroshorea leprosula TaxID=152421 RepID=A0AAV5KAZ2_9ROSI|nr:hypothetical protein SLEP1_g30952 [Rubroshorea leprosula]
MFSRFASIFSLSLDCELLARSLEVEDGLCSARLKKKVQADGQEEEGEGEEMS